MALIVTDENYSEVINGDLPVVLDFWAEWCGPCRMVGPIIEDLAAEYKGVVAIGKVDIDENDELVGMYGIRNIPTILFFKKGVLVDKQIGAAGINIFREKINRLIS